MSPEELAFIREAAEALKRSSWILRISDTVGRPFEKAVALLPGPARQALGSATQRALQAALKTALVTIPKGSEVQVESEAPTFERGLSQVSRLRLTHGAAATAAGVLGGLLGLPALVVELPVTTTLILRSLLRVAEEMGFNPRDPWTQMECLLVFALGSPSRQDDAMESSYYATRVALGTLVAESAAFVAARSQAEILRLLAEGGAPSLVKLVAQVGTRFQGVVTQKFVAEAIPVAGALMAGSINALFVAHFTGAARHHFGLKKLEKLHGEAAVRAVFESSPGTR